MSQKLEMVVIMKIWNPRVGTLNTISEKTNDLVDNFEYYLNHFQQRFDEGATFDGPSLYFHFKSINAGQNSSLNDKLNNINLLEYIYATLSSWGMHRMGDTKTKLTNFNYLIKEIKNYSEEFSRLENLKMWELEEASLNVIFSKLEGPLNNIKISKSRAQLVSNTKFLHHLFPNLIIPIDRNYTLKCFGVNIQAPSQYYAFDIFKILYVNFVNIAIAKRDFILEKINMNEENWNTSFTKVIDNAIIGSQI